jgi:hypothetical protein
MWKNETGATASQGARFPSRLGHRRRRIAHAAVLFFRITPVCVLWFLPNAVCCSAPFADHRNPSAVHAAAESRMSSS